MLLIIRALLQIRLWLCLVFHNSQKAFLSLNRWWPSCCFEILFWWCELWTWLHQCHLHRCKIPKIYCKCFSQTTRKQHKLYQSTSDYLMVEQLKCYSAVQQYIWHSGLLSREKVHCHPRYVTLISNVLLGFRTSEVCASPLLFASMSTILCSLSAFTKQE